LPVPRPILGRITGSAAPDIRHVGNIVTALKAKGLAPEQIVARLTSGQA